MTTLANLSASDLRRAAQLKEGIEALQRQLDAVFGGNNAKASFTARRSVYVTRAPVRRRGVTTSGKTVAACVLEALGSGNTMGIKDIIGAASRIRGKSISKALMAFTLVELKKAKKVENPERGQYRIKH